MSPELQGVSRQPEGPGAIRVLLQQLWARGGPKTELLMGSQGYWFFQPQKAPGRKSPRGGPLHTPVKENLRAG